VDSRKKHAAGFRSLEKVERGRTFWPSPWVRGFRLAYRVLSHGARIWATKSTFRWRAGFNFPHHENELRRVKRDRQEVRTVLDAQ